ncbi:hypothetical protein [Devosia sp. A369]
MLWSRLFRPIAMAGVLLGAGTMLGACSFTPVYGGTTAAQPALSLAYAKPASRLEQIIYQELALRFGSSDAETARLAMVTASASAVAIGLSATANPYKLTRVTVTATLNISDRDGTKPLSITRHASADYTTSDQVLANQAAATEAGERAAKAAAESLRLGLLAALSR